jgi:short-subunit dehydrogenase
MFSASKYGPWALITGGSEGVGASFARQVGAAGINVVLVARKQGALAETADRVRRESGVEVRTLSLDVSSSDMMERIAAATDDIEVGLFISNIGAVLCSGPFVDAKFEAVVRSVQLNPLAQVALCHHFGKKMAARGRGGIVIVGSMAGNAGGATMVVYGANKAFAQNLAEGLWYELKPRGIDVLYMVLGATDTPKRARQGFQDPPGLYVAPPDEVARDGLQNLDNGPVHVPTHLATDFARFCSLPRREAAEAMSKMLTGFDESRTKEH